MGQIKELNKLFALEIQQRKWNNYILAKLLYLVKPVVGHNKMWDSGTREESIIMLLLCSSFDFLKHTTGIYYWIYTFCNESVIQYNYVVLIY